MKKYTPVQAFYLIALAFIVCAGLIQCKSARGDEPIAVRDSTITAVTAITQLVLDSAYIESFVAANNMEDSSARRLRNFYISRNYQYTWFTEDGLTEQARAFWNLRNHYQRFNKDSSLINKKLDTIMHQLTNPDTSMMLSNKDKVETEVALTQHFFQYAQYAYAGKIDPEELQWHIPRKKLNPVALLDSLINNKSGNTEWEPVNEQYSLMQKHLERYAEIENTGGWPVIRGTGRYVKGNKDSTILFVKQILHSTGDLEAFDSTTVFDSTLAIAVQKARGRFGLKQDAVIDKELIRELNVSVQDRIQQILVNMERMRWLPKATSGNRIEANIPEFKLHVFEDGEEVWNMNIVVGKSGTSSVIFTDELKYVVFSPYWNIPSSIVRNEIVPGMRKNANYLASKNMEITSYSNGLPVVRQRPGGSNALGDVKFIFPNSYNIYFHDTPSKSLFKKDKRAFSHGCIRLEEPFKLAKYLLRSDTAWKDSTIQSAMKKGEEKWVTLKKSVPVFITYFTAWVNQAGELHFREDIYRHDEKMKERLFR